MFPYIILFNPKFMGDGMFVSIKGSHVRWNSHPVVTKMVDS